MITPLLLSSFLPHCDNSKSYVKLSKQGNFLTLFNIKEQLKFIEKFKYNDYKMILESDIPNKNEVLRMLYDEDIPIYSCSNSQFRSKSLLLEANNYELGDVISVGSWIGQHYWFLKSWKRFTFNEIDQRCKHPLGIYNHRIIMKDMLEIDYYKYDTIVNTSCEHVEYKKWLSKILKGSFMILQSTDFECDEHINPHKSLAHFIEESNLSRYLITSEIDIHDGNKRFFIVGIL